MISKDMDIKDLQKSFVDMRKELSSLKMQLMLGQYNNSSKIKKIRKDMARAKTFIHLKELDR